MAHATIIYYSAHNDDPDFELRVRKTLIRNGRSLPIISVTQQPTYLGQNVCVGKVGVSSHNVYRQMQIGAAIAQTKYVCIAESDSLYPTEYFHFRPTKNRVAYLAEPLYVLINQRGKAKVYYVKPRGSESAMFINRLFLINLIQDLLKQEKFWGNKDASELPRFLLSNIKTERFKLENPIVTIKTDRQMKRRTPHLPETKTRKVAYWGSSDEMLKRYFG